MPKTVIAVCGGAGTSLLPFRDDPDWDIIMNIEPRPAFSTPGEEQWYDNFPGVVKTKNLRYWEYEVDLLIGHPDCGHSSILSLSRAKRFLDPSENASLNMYLESIHKYNPNVFVMENLPKLLETYDKEYWETEYNDYDMTFINDSVAYYGNSQMTRKRLLIIGIKKTLKKVLNIKPVDFIPKTCEELIGDIENYIIRGLGHVREDSDKEVCLWWEGKKLTLFQVQQYWNNELKDKGSWPGHYNCKTQPGVYKLFKDKTPKTARKQNRQFNYNGLSLTPRELARIQGFPDSFIIHFDRDWDKKEYWINKGRTAVTKCPPYEMFVWLKNLCDNEIF